MERCRDIILALLSTNMESHEKAKLISQFFQVLQQSSDETETGCLDMLASTLWNIGVDEYCTNQKQGVQLLNQALKYFEHISITAPYIQEKIQTLSESLEKLVLKV